MERHTTMQRRVVIPTRAAHDVDVVDRDELSRERTGERVATGRHADDLERSVGANLRRLRRPHPLHTRRLDHLQRRGHSDSREVWLRAAFEEQAPGHGSSAIKSHHHAGERLPVD